MNERSDVWCYHRGMSMEHPAMVRNLTCSTDGTVPWLGLTPKSVHSFSETNVGKKTAESAGTGNEPIDCLLDGCIDDRCTAESSRDDAKDWTAMAGSQYRAHGVPVLYKILDAYALSAAVAARNHRWMRALPRAGLPGHVPTPSYFCSPTGGSAPGRRSDAGRGPGHDLHLSCEGGLLCTLSGYQLGAVGRTQQRARAF